MFLSMADILQYLLILPVILLALSVHESAHGYAAYKLGDPTASSLGRLTLNPLKHLDVFGFLCMLFFHFGWAKPVPVNTRHFKKPRRDMAITAAAGPASNILLSLLFALLLRIELIFTERFFADDIYTVAIALTTGSAVPVMGMGFKMMSVLTYILFMGVLLNINLAVFNLIPIPPFDGSRIAYIFMPPKLYFRVMKYEQFIMIAILLLLWFVPFFSSLIGSATTGLSSLILSIFGIRGESNANFDLNVQISYLSQALFS